MKKTADRECAQSAGREAELLADLHGAQSNAARVLFRRLVLFRETLHQGVYSRTEERLLFRNEDERKRAREAGIEDLDKVYQRDEMVTEDVIFAATGVTDGSIVTGARRDGEWMETETILMRSKTGSVRRLLYRQRNH